MLAPAPGSLQIDATLGGGGHTERILEATDPDGRLLGLDADGAAIARVAGRLRPRFGDRLVLRQANFRELADGRARGRASAPSTAACSTSGSRATSWPTRDRGFGFRAGGPLDMRFDTSRGVPAAELLATLDADELTALFRPLRRGAEGRPRSPGRSSTPAGPRRSRPPRSSRRSSSASRRRTRASRDGRIPRRASSRPCASRSTRSSMRSRPGSPPRSTCSGPAAGSSSSATTRSRTASSSASSPPSGAAASARPNCRSASAAANPRLRLVDPAVADPVGRRDRRQPTRPERPPAGRRAPRRLEPTRRRRAGRRAGHHRNGRRSPHEQAPPVQPPQGRTAAASTRCANGTTDQHHHDGFELELDDWGPPLRPIRSPSSIRAAPRLRFALGD